jgi:hypothetical protein
LEIVQTEVQRVLSATRMRVGGVGQGGVKKLRVVKKKRGWGSGCKMDGETRGDPERSQTQGRTGTHAA